MIFSYKRIFFVVLLCLLALYAPFWVTFLFAVGCIMYFSNFAEAVFIGLAIDLSHGVPLARFYGFELVAFALFLILLIVAEILKKKMLSGGSFKGTNAKNF